MAPIDERIDLVVLDAGHGGKDPGALGVHAREKDICLKIALKVEKLLESSGAGINVEMTRKTDEFVDLLERPKFANAKKADLFISIHCNANVSKIVHGCETYAMGMHKHEDNLKTMMRENAAILLEDNHQEKYDGFDPKSEESYIIFKLHQHAYIKQSLDLAEKIEKHIVTNAKRASRGVKQAGFLVLWKTSMPAVLIEMGFVTNKVEEKYLASAEGQDYIAGAIAKAVLAYKKAQR